MNEHGKSDRLVVPKKSPNKAGADKAPVAEGMEGRSLTKGNSIQQNRRRTQCRERVHNALERVRAVARKDKQARFTALLHHIYDRNTLEFAFLSLKKSASPGEGLKVSLVDSVQYLYRGTLDQFVLQSG